MHDVLLIFYHIHLYFLLYLFFFLYVAVTEYRFLIILHANIAPWRCVVNVLCVRRTPLLSFYFHLVCRRYYQAL